MCGFAGFLGDAGHAVEQRAILVGMANTLIHRGPDEQGIWIDKQGVVGLAHRRLAVVGLGESGRQPMCSRSGRWVIAYNGEIYNAPVLRKELERSGTPFHGTSDTEVLLAAIEDGGLMRALARCVGMFAFAVWDTAANTLYLCRDRFGEKPLYYGWQASAFLFGSDLAALRAHPAFVGGVDRQALACFTARNYIPAPLSIHPGIAKLQPGHVLSVHRRNEIWQTETTVYWSALPAAQSAASQPFAGTEEDAVQTTHELLLSAVQHQMVAEVPVGAFLSGGIDSSLVVALMQQVSTAPVRSYTIGFSDPAYDESAFAAGVATHLGVAHVAHRFDPAEALALIPELPTLYSEPFADASQLPTLLVSRLARSAVTVALSGDGGDEVFGGYNRYVWAEPLWRRFGSLPLWMRQALGRLLMMVPPARWDSVTGWHSRLRQPGEKAHKLGRLLLARSPAQAYESLIAFWQGENPVIGATPAFQEPVQQRAVWGAGGFTASMMLADTLSYLPDDILVKVDRAAMGVSLETRAPFLDHRLFEFVWSLPLSSRVGDGGSKLLLRKILDRYLPRHLVERPKAGFALPIHQWLRGPLRDWAESLLDPIRLRDQGYFDLKVVRTAWQEHLSGQRNRQYDLWSVLMFQAWLESRR